MTITALYNRHGQRDQIITPMETLNFQGASVPPHADPTVLCRLLVSVSARASALLFVSLTAAELSMVMSKNESLCGSLPVCLFTFWQRSTGKGNKTKCGRGEGREILSGCYSCYSCKGSSRGQPDAHTPTQIKTSLPFPGFHFLARAEF